MDINTELKNDVIKALKEIELKDDGVVIKVEFETDICKNEDIACEKVNISINKKEIDAFVNDTLMLYNSLKTSKCSTFAMNSLTNYDSYFIANNDNFTAMDVYNYVIANNILNDRNRYISILYSFYYHINQLIHLMFNNAPYIVIKQVLVCIIYDDICLKSRKDIVKR